MADGGAQRAQQMYEEGVLAFRRGDNEECRRLSQLAVDIAAKAGTAREQALGHIGLSRAAFRELDYPTGLRHAHRAEDLAAGCGAEDVRLTALHMRAELTRAQGDYAAAVPLYEQLLVADEEAGDTKSLAMEHYNLGSVLLQTGELPAAREHLTASLRTCREANAWGRDMLHYALLGMAGLLAREGDPFTAARLLGAVQAHVGRIGEVLDPAEELELSSHVQAARRADPAGFASAYAEGQAMTTEDAAAFLDI